jgi:hypothetical protein
VSPSRSHQALLTELLEGERTASDWLKSPQARQLLGTVKVGSVPRDVQLVAHEGELVVGVESVHAFLQAELSWWIVSILWTVAFSATVEPCPLSTATVAPCRFRTQPRGTTTA